MIAMREYIQPLENAFAQTSSTYHEAAPGQAMCKNNRIRNQASKRRGSDRLPQKDCRVRLEGFSS